MAQSAPALYPSNHDSPRPSAATPDRLEKILDQLGLRWDVEALAALSEYMDGLPRSGRPAPFAAAAIAAHVVAMRADAELLAWWLADLVLAQNLRWPRPLPLLMAQAFGPPFRAEAGGKRIRPDAGVAACRAHFSFNFLSRPGSQ
ncbi:DUF1403 family protein [Mesorhizobium sp. RIZ17]|uniref:DUF1403 family protein n=1 Tax=Mesorhizobium sp. RIZ17 TaxID=3132743 RepID=UPI003DAA1B40